MNVESRSFLDALLQQSTGLSAQYSADVEYWAPEEPPFIVLLGALGRQIVEEFEQAGADANKRIFALIEEAVADNGDLGTAVTTGLIEAIVNKAERMDLWLPISNCFGKLSLNYIDAWFAQQERIARTIAFG